MMSDDDERIKFEITDYDLENEFTINRKGRQTKNQAIYGIWADKEDEDNVHSNTFGKKKDYSAPVNFIAGGVHIAGKKKEEVEAKVHDPSDEENIVDLDSDSSVEEIKIHTPFNAAPRKEQTMGEIAGLRKHSTFVQNNILTQKGVGNWEKHTKGIGAKLLLQMGFQPGKGLGKDLQGIQAPIEAHLRKGRGAIGAYGPEKKTKEAKIITETSDNEVGDEKPKRISQWRKEHWDDNSKKIRYVYKSVNDILEENKKPGGNKKRVISELSKVKVIDMTGPEQRVLSGYHAIAGVQKPAEEWEIRREKKFSNFSMPELQHNLNLLVDLTEQAIIENDQKLKQDEDQIIILEGQLKQKQTNQWHEKKLIDNLTHIVETMDTISAGAEENNLSLDNVAEKISSLREKHYAEFFMYEIPCLTVEIIKPMVRARLENWNPLTAPAEPISLFTQWKHILQTNENVASAAPGRRDAYHTLVFDTWVPRVRASADSWSCREWGPMVEMIVSWIPLLSAWILDTVLKDIVLMRIQNEVSEWNPLTDCVPIHSWIYPWINFLGKYFKTTVYPVIRQKLSVALISWHPSDSSARLMLQPWVSVFEPGEMDAFILHNIVPKLQLALQDVVISPDQQQLDNWNWVMEWSEMISPLSMAMLLDTQFFPKWIKVLKMWLAMNPNYDLVRGWYTSWKAIIPLPILTQPIVKDHLRTALEIMSRPVGGPGPVTLEEKNVKQMAENFAEAIRTASKIPEGYRDMVQKKCEEKGILWMPVIGRYMEGKPIYRCGKHQVYIDGNVLFVSQDGGAFTPMSMHDLLDHC